MAPRIEKKSRATIKSVTFRSNVGIGPYQHVHVEATADVPRGEDPALTLDRVKKFVAAELRRARTGERPTAPVERQGRFSDMLRDASNDSNTALTP